MLVCSCHAVNDAHVRALITEGASDEGEIGLRCGAGTDCGSCVGKLGRLLDEMRDPARPGTLRSREVVATGV